ncbi:surface protease GP63 [Trypanosoma theileri]|uniref:Leishmanolysin-like peptidase n=1 Tax=Trypanosoma theileri TaxID=67003 RepID=A0A1X0NKI2_9TRYP|nr:surface protease GP63 [Trypanosoma theileri]ORC85157.1 surface protease GP63 [Trypanosoma theileri]
MVLYVAAGPPNGLDDIWAVPCAVLEQDGRPVAAGINFVVRNIVFERSVARVTAHVIAHALGFSYGRMKALNMISNVTNKRKDNKAVVVKSEKKNEGDGKGVL